MLNTAPLINDDILLIIYNIICSSIQGHSNTMLLVCKHWLLVLSNARETILMRTFHPKALSSVYAAIEEMKVLDRPYLFRLNNEYADFGITVYVIRVSLRDAHGYHTAWRRLMLLKSGKYVAEFLCIDNRFRHYIRSYYIYWDQEPLIFIAKYIPNLYTSLVTDIPVLCKR